MPSNDPQNFLYMGNNMPPPIQNYKAPPPMGFNQYPPQRQSNPYEKMQQSSPQEYNDFSGFPRK